ncbi:hypothetical protein C8R43DRAFT_945231 [Mycena crocata]|nr:hypothetical protein C8R43DRAFT_945231 [Mycena crocata]
MSKTASSGNKHKKRPPKGSNDSRTFRLGQFDIAKRNPNIMLGIDGFLIAYDSLDNLAHSGTLTLENVAGNRHRKESYMTQCKPFSRTAAKLKKRQWDPAKKLQAAASAGAESSNSAAFEMAASEGMDDTFQFRDPRAESDGVAPEECPAVDHEGTSDLNALHALAQLAHGAESSALQSTVIGKGEASSGLVEVESAEFRVNENPIDDWRAGSLSSGDFSILEKANQLSSHGSDEYPYLHAPQRSPIPLAVRHGNLPSGVTPLNGLQSLALRITGDIGPLTVVQAAQIQVAERNSGTLTPPTPDDASRWRVRGTFVTDLWSYSDLTRKEVATGRWRSNVFSALRRARLAGEEVVASMQSAHLAPDDKAR